MKRIERPDWSKVNFPLGGMDKLNNWFNTYIEPINQLIDGAVEVYGHYVGAEAEAWTRKIYSDKDDHKALLIGIEPIKKETAEDVLRDIIKFDDANYGNIAHGYEPLYKRAKAVLENKE